MYDVAVARRLSLGALVALAVLAGALFVATVAAPKASAAGCNYMQVCIWTQTWQNGTISWWSANDFGCHSHALNPKINSAFNNTPYTVHIGVYTMPAWTGINYFLPTYATGDVCWTA